MLQKLRNFNRRGLSCYYSVQRFQRQELYALNPGESIFYSEKLALKLGEDIPRSECFALELRHVFLWSGFLHPKTGSESSEVGTSCLRSEGYYPEVGFSCLRFKAYFSGVGFSSPRIGTRFTEVGIPSPSFGAEFYRFKMTCPKSMTDHPKT